LTLIKQLLGLAAALALTTSASPGWAQDGDSLRDPLARNCDAPEYPREALRYELEGTTWLAFDLDDEGRPSQPRLHRGSGWALLDEAAVRQLRSCRFDPKGDPQVRRSNVKTAYQWKLGPAAGKGTPAVLVADTCQVSDRFDSFIPLSGQSPNQEGVRVRLLVDPAGKAFGIKFEEEAPQEIRQAGAAYLQSCRFIPAQGKAGPAPGNLVGRLIPKVG
jgi:TonB family protein